MQMGGVFAELAMVREQVRSCMVNAKAKGKHVGRLQTTKEDIPASFYKHDPAYVAGRMNVSGLARMCGLDRLAVYKYLKMVG